ncbi:MAG: DUF5009 domain-containing protein [Acidobacteria bacterium]|nr:DUF5009 domain-containing protein [Acidobacteriota bacterium]
MLDNFRQSKWFPVGIGVLMVLLALGSRIAVACWLATDDPGDGRVYAQLAKNLVEQGVFSLATEAPFTPTLIRLPGQPLLIAAVYSIFGVGNDTAVRVVHGGFDTGTCVIVGALAWLWTTDEERRRRNAFWAFLLASLCPFIAIYAATLLSETLTTFLMAAMTLTATLAFRSATGVKCFLWWFLTGVSAGAAVLLRPDSGLFAAAIGLTLVVSGLFFPPPDAPPFLRRIFGVSWQGAVFTLAFLLVLAPWTIRNYRVFGLFQPLAPAHAEMPGEFVPLGYQRWLRTWVDDARFIGPTLWTLNEKPIRMSRFPETIFDSPDERARVTALLDQYNHPPGSEPEPPKSADQSDDSDQNDADDSAAGDEDSADQSDAADDQSDDEESDADKDDDDDNDPGRVYNVKMTPEIDAGFAQLADERIARAPVRYYFWLPVKRAAVLWFDTHSLYYPFGGQISPVEDLDRDVGQQYWLPFFLALTWAFTILAAFGARLMWRERANRETLRWLILLGLMIFLRLGFLATIENPEPRYAVELFALVMIPAGFLLGRLRFPQKPADETPETETDMKENIPAAPEPARMLSLDVFRGMTIAAMILVNNPGTWDAIRPPLEHAEWHGTTPTDLIFPFFLFIVGVSIALSLGRLADGGGVRWKIYFKIAKRALLIFGVGLFLEVFPFYNPWKAAWFDPATVRISGVLQRIAVCYLVAAVVFLTTNWKKQAVIAGALLLVYWALMTLVDVPGCAVTSINDQACNLSAYLDRLILTEPHIWNQSKVYDPEGLLSTLPAIATALAGALTGTWLRTRRDETEKLAGIFFFGVVLIAAGWIWSGWFPLNKKLWTSSYVVYTAGLALCFLGCCYWLVDLKGWRRWATPFVVFGTNAIALYIGSTMMSVIFDMVQIPVAEDKTVSLQEYIFQNVFLPLGAPVDASLYYAVAFILIWLFLLWLLYRKGIFIRL